MWEIFYSDGTSITSEEIDAFHIERKEDVQVIIQSSSDHNWLTLSGTNFYVWEDRGKGWKWWRVNDHFGVDHYLRQPGPRAVLFGTWVEREDFNNIFNDAREKWGNKESFDSGEAHP